MTSACKTEEDFIKLLESQNTDDLIKLDFMLSEAFKKTMKRHENGTHIINIQREEENMKKVRANIDRILLDREELDKIKKK